MQDRVPNPDASRRAATSAPDGRSDLSPARAALWAIAALALFVLMLGLKGVLGAHDRVERLADDAMLALHARGHVGRTALVAIDTESLETIDVWPWPRRVHAELIDRLNAIGVAGIHLDIDFSSPSSPVDDDILADALRRSAVPVSLAAHAQVDRVTGGLVERVPLPLLAEHATVAGVNVMPDAQGLVRFAERGRSFGGRPAPSMTALIAGTPPAESAFEIDFGIDPGAVPVLSVSDVLTGTGDLSALRGAQVIVGATAIELGDIIPVPGHGAVPGPLVQLVAAETLAQDRALQRPGWILVIGLACVLALGAALIWAVAHKRTRLLRAEIVILAALGLLVLVAVAMRARFAVMVPTVSLSLALIGVLVAVASLKLVVQHRAARAARRRIRWLATYDSVTGALQAHAFAGVLAKRADDAAVSLVAFDLRRFGIVRDMLGAERADQMLAATVADLRANDRVTAVGRYGEHEFVLVAEADAARLPGVARLLSETLALALPTERLSLSLGTLALAEFDGSPDEAIAAVRMTTDRAVEHGRSVVPFDREHAATAARRRRQEADLPGAIARDEIALAYQPKVCLSTGRIEGAEALVRWIHPDMGFMRPDEFVNVAEAAGQIVMLGDWVLQRACRDFAALGPVGAGLRVSVNVSPHQFMQGDIAASVRAALRRSGLSIERLELEITESLAIEDPAVVRFALDPLRAAGLTVSLDDFGTGYANLGMLGQLPIDTLKIDRSLILDLPSPRASAMVAAAVMIARGHGLGTVVEGVEDERAAELLRMAGCAQGQGYHWSRPVPFEAFAALLAEEAQASDAQALDARAPDAEAFGGVRARA